MQIENTVFKLHEIWEWFVSGKLIAIENVYCYVQNFYLHRMWPTLKDCVIPGRFQHFAACHPFFLVERCDKSRNYWNGASVCSVR